MVSTNTRQQDLQRFYDLLDELKTETQGFRTLAASDGRMPWPSRGVYFFYEDRECRTDSGFGPRVVRVGTHALTRSSRTSLWNRLSQHRGIARTGAGNHRGSIFRLLIGTSIMARDPSVKVPSWGQGGSAQRDVRAAEEELERLVSHEIGKMPFLFLNIDDGPGPDSQRAFVERNSIALLSNYEKAPLDPPSIDWLGHKCDRKRVRLSGLWNQNHVDGAYDPGLLDVLETLIKSAAIGSPDESEP